MYQYRSMHSVFANACYNSMTAVYIKNKPACIVYCCLPLSILK